MNLDRWLNRNERNDVNNISSSFAAVGKVNWNTKDIITDYEYFKCDEEIQKITV